MVRLRTKLVSFSHQNWIVFMCWKSSINILNQLIMMRLCSFNAHRASNPIKLQAISSFLNKYFPDVVLIQEIHVVLALKHFSS